jgi:hypothetical protein
MPIILATREAEIRRPAWAKSKTLLSKYPTYNKRAGGVAQVVVLLPSQSEALSSNLSTVKKKEKKEKQPSKTKHNKSK